MRKMFLFNGLFESLAQNQWGMESFPSENDPNFNYDVQEVETSTHTIKIEIWTSLDGLTQFKRQSSQSKSKENLENLKKEMKLAIDSEEFEKAAILRDRIKKLSE
jgi:excinuclease UvrABC nuclease subunit